MDLEEACKNGSFDERIRLSVGEFAAMVTGQPGMNKNMDLEIVGI